MALLNYYRIRLIVFGKRILYFKAIRHIDSYILPLLVPLFLNCLHYVFLIVKCVLFFCLSS